MAYCRMQVTGRKCEEIERETNDGIYCRTLNREFERRSNDNEMFKLWK